MLCFACHVRCRKTVKHTEAVMFLFVYVFYQTYDEWKEMLPDFSEYNWVIPDFVWELSEQIDLGNFIYLFIFTNNND